MIGKIISHCKISENLGEGSMGVLYKAKDLKLDRLVASEFLPNQLTFDEEAKTWFIREAKAKQFELPTHETVEAVSDQMKPEVTDGKISE